MEKRSHEPFKKLAWFTLSFLILVIVWGALVRATGSGAGCGEHWPLCNGQVLPLSAQMATWIEFTHRLTSGLSLMLVITFGVVGMRRYPKPHPIRFFCFASIVLIVIEALIGAALVLLGLVAENDSALRAIVMGVHLVNTLLLLGAVAMPIVLLNVGERTFRLQRSQSMMIGAGTLALLLLATTGGIAALGDTLFPAESLKEGIAQDFDSNAPLLLRLRIAHPFFAVLSVILTSFFALRLARGRKPLESSAAAFITLSIAGILVGLLNLWLLAPVWMQLVHLFMADMIWIHWVFLVGRAAYLGELHSKPLQSRREKLVFGVQ